MHRICGINIKVMSLPSKQKKSGQYRHAAPFAVCDVIDSMTGSNLYVRVQLPTRCSFLSHKC